MPGFNLRQAQPRSHGAATTASSDRRNRDKACSIADGDRAAFNHIGFSLHAR